MECKRNKNRIKPRTGRMIRRKQVRGRKHIDSSHACSLGHGGGRQLGIARTLKYFELRLAGEMCCLELPMSTSHQTRKDNNNNAPRALCVRMETSKQLRDGILFLHDRMLSICRHPCSHTDVFTFAVARTVETRPKSFKLQG